MRTIRLSSAQLHLLAARAQHEIARFKTAGDDVSEEGEETISQLSQVARMAAMAPGGRLQDITLSEQEVYWLCYFLVGAPAETSGSEAVLAADGR